MKIVRFTKSIDLNGRHFARSDSYEFEDAIAEQLIADGVADLPVDSRILSEEAPFDPEETISAVTLKPIRKRGKK
jgi:hypothetical protein